MKNKKNILIVGIFAIIITTGLISTSVALEDPEYSEKISGGHAFDIIEYFNEGEVVRIEYDITGGDADLHLYIRNSTGDIIKDLGNIVDYGIRYFYVPYGNNFRIIFKNDALLTPRDIEINIDVVKTLTITSPISTNTFLTGYNNITWTSTGDINFVIIELYKNGVFVERLCSTSNDGIYTIYISINEYTDGSNYQIRISDIMDDTIYDYSDYFTIESEVKTITITSPTSADTFISGDNSITWTTTGDIDYVKIELYKGGMYLETINSYVSFDGIYNWYIYIDEYIDGSDYQIKILDYYDNTIYDYSDYFIINMETETEKTITITSPANTDTFLTTEYNYITWDSTGDINYVLIELYKNGVFLESFGWTNNDGTYTWQIYDDEYTDGTHYQIKVSDYDDDTIYDYSDYFSIECETEEPIIPVDKPNIFIRNLIFYIIIPIVVIVGIILAIAIPLIVVHKKHKKQIPKEIIPISRDPSVKEEPIEPVKSQERELPRIIYCSSCGAEILDKTSDFCTKCGAPLK